MTSYFHPLLLHALSSFLLVSEFEPSSFGDDSWRTRSPSARSLVACWPSPPSAPRTAEDTCWSSRPDSGTARPWTCASASSGRPRAVVNGRVATMTPPSENHYFVVIPSSERGQIDLRGNDDQNENAITGTVYRCQHHQWNELATNKHFI